MKRTWWEDLRPDQVDPERLSLLLVRHGWVPRGGRPGLYTRYALEPNDEASTSGFATSLLLPLNREMADYEDLLRVVLDQLTRLAPIHKAAAEEVLDGLRVIPGDEVRFRKETTTVRGTVPWPIGEELVVSSRDTLLAAAKARVSKSAYYGNKNGRFAHRFLDAVLMGQTEIGSYIVTAYTPVESVFHERETRDGRTPLPTVLAYTGREITQALVVALEATQEAAAHFESSASMSGFDDAIKRGVSRELAQAVLGLVEKAVEAEVRVDWAVQRSTQSNAVETNQVPEPVSFQFTGALAPVLEKAVARYAGMTPAEFVTALGWVSVVERPKRGAPGVVRLRVLRGSKANTIRVRLTQEQFEVAADAIKDDQAIFVSGRQEKDGRTFWLYDVTELGATEIPDEAKRRTPRSLKHDRTPGPGQSAVTDEDVSQGPTV